MADESTWEELLRIHTGGLDEGNADEHHYRYEPTPYRVLEQLAESGLIGEGDTLLDYGCGKGRVCFFLSHRTKAQAIGIEYNERLYAAALENRSTAAAGGRVDFVLCRAEEYEVPETVNRCFFFNPFSAALLSKVMARILASFYENPREIRLIFYYPFDDYVSYLMGADEPELCGEIACGRDPQDRLMVFSLSACPED